MKITIILPYADAVRNYRIWAHEEEKIDFRHEKERACRCTVSFAAEELESYLKRMGFDAIVSENPGTKQVSEEKKSNTGLVVGLAVGGSIAIILIVGVPWLVVRKKRG